LLKVEVATLARESTGKLRSSRIFAVITALKSLLSSPRPVIEPIATRLVPWWPAFAGRVANAGGRVDEWKFDAPLPPALAALDEAAGFQRESLSARSAVFGIS